MILSQSFKKKHMKTITILASRVNQELYRSLLAKENGCESGECSLREISRWGILYRDIIPNQTLRVNVRWLWSAPCTNQTKKLLPLYFLGSHTAKFIGATVVPA